jgi:hypothetical protein
MAAYILTNPRGVPLIHSKRLCLPYLVVTLKLLLTLEPLEIYRPKGSVLGI